MHDWASPSDASFRKGMYVGFDGRHGKFHMYRSLLEGIALTMKNHVDKMQSELKREITEVVLTGGGANSDLFCQIFADVFGLKVRRNIIK